MPCLPNTASSAINSLHLFSSSSNTSSAIIQEGDRFFRLRCQVTANPSITVKWSRRFLYAPLTDKDSVYLMANMSSLSAHWAINNFIIDNQDSNGDTAIDWSRSNVSQYDDRDMSSHNGQTPNSHLIVSELVISDVSLIDAGIYTCITPNDSKHISVFIEHHPRIFYRRNSLMAAADRGTPFVKFVCSAIAYPFVSFNWTVKSNKMISEANAADGDKYRVVGAVAVVTNATSHTSLSPTEMERYHFSSELIVHGVDDDDYGNYKCAAYNHLGLDQVTFQLVEKSM